MTRLVFWRAGPDGGSESKDRGLRGCTHDSSKVSGEPQYAADWENVPQVTVGTISLIMTLPVWRICLFLFPANSTLHGQMKYKKKDPNEEPFRSCYSIKIPVVSSSTTVESPDSSACLLHPYQGYSCLFKSAGLQRRSHLETKRPNRSKESCPAQSCTHFLCNQLQSSFSCYFSRSSEFRTLNPKQTLNLGLQLLLLVWTPWNYALTTPHWLQDLNKPRWFFLCWHHTCQWILLSPTLQTRTWVQRG